MSSSDKVEFVGYQDSLFSKGPEYWIEMGKAWLVATNENLPEDTQQAIADAGESLSKVESDLAASLKGIDPTDIANLDKLTEVATKRAQAKQEHDDKVQALRESPSRDSFVKLLESYDLKVAGQRGGGGGLSTDKVYRVKVGQIIRYYLPSDDMVTCYASNGKGSDELFNVTKEAYPNLFPTSATALQRLHYIAYRESTKTWANVVDRLKAAESEYATWDKAIGQSSKATNGLNDTTTIDKTPEDWLKENPVKEKESK